MAQPYDLSGLIAAHATIVTMVKDQTTGTTKFAGGAQTWTTPQTGVFLATLAVGGLPVPTTTNNIRAALTNLKYGFDLLDAGAGTSATGVTVTAVAAYASQSAVGGVAQQTNYDLSGIAAVQTTLTAMLADQTGGVTDFVDGNPFQAILTGAGNAQTATMVQVRLRLAAVLATFDQLAQ